MQTAFTGRALFGRRERGRDREAATQRDIETQRGRDTERDKEEQGLGEEKRRKGERAHSRPEYGLCTGHACRVTHSATSSSGGQSVPNASIPPFSFTKM